MRLRLVHQTTPNLINPAFGVVTDWTHRYVLQQHDGVRWRTLEIVDYDKLSDEERAEILSMVTG
jgi:hypothetical protein